MKASELIKELEEYIEEHGDLECWLDSAILDEDDIRLLYSSDGWILVIE